jgi:HPt (histidine-containing phosphotransfer) domain-containing protein
VDHELNELKREFLAEAREKVEEMQSILESSASDFDRLAYLAHQLKGSGGSYGYQRISIEAAQIEKAAESLAGEKGDRDELTANARARVASLRREIEGAAGGL